MRSSHGKSLGDFYLVPRMLSTLKHRLRHFSSKLQKNSRTSTMSQQSGNKDYREICSERTIFSDQQGFFGEMFDIVRKCCTNQWLTQRFYAANSDADKLRVLFNETCVSDSLFGTLEHVQPVYRKKDAAFSYKRRIDGEQLHRHNDLNNAFLLLTQAVLRAPAKGERERERRERRERKGEQMISSKEM